MYFDGCKSIEELNEVRENLITCITKEYSDKCKEIKQLLLNKRHEDLVRQAKSYEDTNVTYTAYDISKERCNRNEIIFNVNGTVTI